MAFRLVRARPRTDRLPDLRRRLDDGDIEEMEPFGRAMTESLNRVRFDAAAGEAVWVEEDYCTPPLAMEREVLDRYFEDLEVVEADVDEAKGWERIEAYPSLWDALADDA